MYWPSSADPFYVANPTQNTARKTYYGVNATPTLKVDGVLDIWPISEASVSGAIYQRQAITSHIWLDMSATVNGGNMNATAKAVTDMNISGNKVIQMVLVNRYSYIANPPNGNPNFYAAMRVMAPSANGQPFSATAGDTGTYTCTFHLNPTWDVNNLDLVCFVQDNDTWEVLQSHMEPATVQPMLNVDLVLAPVSPPIQIPASGGSFSFNSTITNIPDSSLHFFAWIMQQIPSGAWQGPMLGPIWLYLPAAATITRLRNQSVPETALPGSYTYRGYVGMYNADARWDSSSFTYVKLPTGDGPLVGDWANSGEAFELTDIEAIHESALQPEAFTVTAYPNPFNPTTILSFELREASYVRLEVFDVNGRIVQNVGFGESDLLQAGVHQITFDGSGLPSGIYLYRIAAGDQAAVGKMVLMK